MDEKTRAEIESGKPVSIIRINKDGASLRQNIII